MGEANDADICLRSEQNEEVPRMCMKVEFEKKLRVSQSLAVRYLLDVETNGRLINNNRKRVLRAYRACVIALSCV